jgi:molybdate transport system substrate-binding protein
VSRALAALLVLLLWSAPRCGGDDDSRLTVFAAASLQDVLPRIDRGPRYVFGGSSQLAAQLRDGAPGDVFVSASEPLAEELAAAGVLERPVVVASNRLVVIVPRSGSRVGVLSDLLEPGVKLVVGAEGVPAGDYAREALPAAGLGSALGNVVSLEDDVKGVVAKVALGEADAGVAYATDARIAADRVRVIHIPEAAQPAIAYAAAVIERSPEPVSARAYIDRLVGTEGGAAFREHGFLPPRP